MNFKIGMLLFLCIKGALLFPFIVKFREFYNIYAWVNFF
jgi:hypothetical protein